MGFYLLHHLAVHHLAVHHIAVHHLAVHHLAVHDLEDAVAKLVEHVVDLALLVSRSAVNPQPEVDVRGVLLAASEGSRRVVDAACIERRLGRFLGVVQLHCLVHDALLLGLPGCRLGRHFERVDVASCVRGCKSLNSTNILNKF